jgi:gliding motility-associated-like protein
MNCPDPAVSPNAASTTYAVTVTYNNICTVTAQTVIYAEANNRLYVPNAFTPNKDGNNDVFNVFVSNYKEFSLSIYNRWGEKVFEGTTPEEVANHAPKYGWDGTYKGAMQPVEVYAYYVTVVFINGEVQHLKGSVTLIR